MSAIQLKRWSREEYDKRIEAGVMSPDERVELVDGDIIQVTAQNARHATAVRAAEEALRLAYRKGYDVRTRLPLAIGPDSEPEPDVAVALGHWRDYVHAHPTTALLVVEVADSSLDFDRRRQGRIYAQVGIPEYWIVNLIDRGLDVFRDPRPGVGYQTEQRFGADGAISPLTMPAARIAVKDVLP